MTDPKPITVTCRTCGHFFNDPPGICSAPDCCERCVARVVLTGDPKPSAEERADNIAALASLATSAISYAKEGVVAAENRIATLEATLEAENARLRQRPGPETEEQTRLCFVQLTAENARLREAIEHGVDVSVNNGLDGLSMFLRETLAASETEG